MSKKSKIAKILSFAIIAVMLCGIFSFNVSAADPVIIDFSKFDFSDEILQDMGGNGYMEMMADGDKQVLLVECTEGYVAEDDPDGTGTLGDLYGSIIGFEDYNVDADAYQWMKIGLKNASAAPHFELHFASPAKGLSVETSVNLDITPNSDYTSYVFNVTDAAKKYYPKRPADVENPDVYPDFWHGLISIFRLDFMHYEESGGRAKTGDKLYIEYIAFFDSEQAANDFVFTPTRTVAAINAENGITEAEAVPETTAAPAEAETADGDTTAAAEEVTEAADDEDSGGISLPVIIGIAAGAVVVIAVIIALVLKSKGKTKK